MKTVPSANTSVMNTIYLSHSTQVAEGTFFRKRTLLNCKGGYGGHIHPFWPHYGANCLTAC